MKILIIGGKGWIGSKCAQAWPDESIISDRKINSVADVVEILENHQPDVVLNAAGIVGQPNVDWCDSHPRETIFGNTVLPIMIAEACQRKNIYLLHIGSGCIYYGYSSDPKGWKPEDPANPEVAYTKSKYAADLALSTFDNIGIARIRMPIDRVPYRANLIDKLASYPKIIDVTNSVTVIEDMLNVFHRLLQLKATGIFHVTNPGAISHREIIALYEKYVDPAHSNEWISEDELIKSGLTKKKRSNNILQSPNLEKLGIQMRPVQEAMLDTMQKRFITK